MQKAVVLYCTIMGLGVALLAARAAGASDRNPSPSCIQACNDQAFDCHIEVDVADDECDEACETQPRRVRTECEIECFIAFNTGDAVCDGAHINCIERCRTSS